MKKILLQVMLISAVFCCAAENDNGFRGDRGGNRGNRGNRENFNNRGNRGGMMMRNIVFIESEIAAKSPAEFAEAEALREQYEAKLAEAAKKAGVELPESRESVYRKLRKAYPAEFAAAAEKMKTSPREGMTMLFELAKKAGINLFGTAGNSGRNRPEQMQTPPPPEKKRSFARPDMGKLRQKYPEKMREYDALRQKDSKAARDLLLKIIEEDKGGKK